MDLCDNPRPNLVMGLATILIPAGMPEKAAAKMETRLYIGNLSKSTTQEELNTLFAQAGKVTAVEVIKERKSGESKGFAFITMSEQTEADQAIRCAGGDLDGGVAAELAPGAVLGQRELVVVIVPGRRADVRTSALVQQWVLSIPPLERGLVTSL